MRVFEARVAQAILIWFLLGIAYSATSLAQETSVEVGGLRLELSPSTPTLFEPLVLTITGIDANQVCSLGMNGHAIDYERRQIKVSLQASAVGFTGCPGRFIEYPLGNLAFGEYEDVWSIVVFNESVTVGFEGYEDTVLYDEDKKIATLDYYVTQPVQNRFHETPQQGSVQSGVGVVRGWACDVTKVEVQFDDGEFIEVPYGGVREDTRSICGDANNGYGYVLAWRNLALGPHIMKTYYNGNHQQPAFEVSFEVSGLDEVFATGLSGTYELSDFPAPGTSVVVEWSEADQNFVILEQRDF